MDDEDDEEDQDDSILSRLLSDGDDWDDTVVGEAASQRTNSNPDSECTLDDDDEEDDGYSTLLFRLQHRDPTLTRLELYPMMLWNMNRWRRRILLPDSTATTVVMDMSAWISSIAHLLDLAQDNPQLTHLELSHLPLHHPLLIQSLIRLFKSNRGSSNDCRVWKQLTLEDCDTYSPFGLAWLMPGHIRSLNLRTKRGGISDPVDNDDESGWKDLGRLLYQEQNITKKPTLQELLVQVEILTPQGMRYLVQGWKGHSCLRKLDFSTSRFQAGGRRNDPVDASANHNFDDPDGESTVIILASGLVHLPNLQSLSLAYCSLTDTQVATIVHSLLCPKQRCSRHSTLAWLNLDHNQVDVEAATMISQLLHHDESSQLSGLILNGCGIRDATLQIMLRPPSSTLPSSQRDQWMLPLQHLHLSDNSITDDGIIELGKTIVQPIYQNLQTVWVSENNMSQSGAQALLDAVRTNPGLLQVVVDFFLPSFSQIQFVTLLNRGGKRLLASCHNNKTKQQQQQQQHVPLGLWPLVFARAHQIQHATRQGGAVDIIYHSLVEYPSLCQGIGQA